MGKWAFASSIMLAFFASPLVAQEPSSVAAVPDGCELHVWPSQGLRSVANGWIKGAINDGAVTGRKGYSRLPSDAIDTGQQVSLIRNLDLPGGLGLTGYRQIVHAEPVPTSLVRASTSRLTASASPCYAELIADDVFFQQDWVTGSYLKTLFRYRFFGEKHVPSRIFGTFVETELSAFPASRPDQYVAARDEINAAFVKNLSKFSNALNKPPKKH